MFIDLILHKNSDFRKENNISKWKEIWREWLPGEQVCELYTINLDIVVEVAHHMM